jgi:hypothetical protein
MKIISKSILMIIALISIITTVTACKAQNGKVITQERKTIPYSKIQVSDGWDLILSQGDEYSIKITANENLLDGLKTEVIDDVLIISSSTKAIKGKGIRKKVYLTFIEVNQITTNKDSDISAETTIKSDTLNIELNDDSDLDNVKFEGGKLIARLTGSSKMNMSFTDIKHIDTKVEGSSKISLTEIRTDTFKLILSSDSEANLVGYTKNFDVQASNESEIKASGLRVTNCLLNLFSSSKAEIIIEDTLDVTLSGNSELELIGSPNFVNKEVCKSCKIEMK